MDSRNTWQRECILKCLQENFDKHLTIQNIEDLLRKKSFSISTTTIYRQLNKLVELNIVRKFKIDGQNSACYQYIENLSSCCNHFHLVCSNCAKIVHFRCDALVDICKSINDDGKFKIDLPKTIFYGVCEQCLKN